MADFGEIEGVEGGEETALEISGRWRIRRLLMICLRLKNPMKKKIVTIDLDKLEEMMAEEMEEGRL